jgi:hypothetical protein
MLQKKCGGVMVKDFAPQNGGEVFKSFLPSFYIPFRFLGEL